MAFLILSGSDGPGKGQLCHFMVQEKQETP